MLSLHIREVSVAGARSEDAPGPVPQRNHSSLGCRTVADGRASLSLQVRALCGGNQGVQRIPRACRRCLPRARR